MEPIANRAIRFTMAREGLLRLNCMAFGGKGTRDNDRSASMTVLGWIAVGLGALVVVLTFLPLVPADAGWIRMWDFPRPQIAVAAFAALLMVAVAAYGGVWPLLPAIAFTTIVACALGYQLLRIYPYTPAASFQVRQAASGSGDASCFSLMAVNVYQHNRTARPLLDLVARHDPDILLAVETDRWWRDQFGPLAARYPHVASLPLENTYGMIFMTRLAPVEPVEFRFLIKDDIPSVKTELMLENGERVSFYGLHPEPPTPVTDSTERDMELIAVAREVAREKIPAIVAGDLNDVAWSPTTREFKQLSGMNDPRVGRGLYATFHAKVPGMRWPLDHLFLTPGITLDRLQVLPGIGSDHFPVFARLCLEKSGQGR